MAPGNAALREDPPDGLQAAFARAAEDYGVPRSVLLAVSYLESRWDGNGGLPSVSGGYGPMHLVDGRLAVPPESGGHHHGEEDPRGDETRPMRPPAPAPAAPQPLEDTLGLASRLTGIPADRLREDPAANVRGGAALLAEYQRRTGGPADDDPARWYGAVARYAGSDDAGAAAVFADEVYATIRTGAARVTDGGERVVLPSDPSANPPAGSPERLGLRRAAGAAAAAGPDCPASVSCVWLPSPYKRLKKKGHYGNHDRLQVPRKIDYIVIHDGESSFRSMINSVRNPTYLSWHFTLRSGDGRIAQHLRGQDIGWHAGNWDVNSRSIGLEHEGYLARGGAWYTEAMYRASAKLVRHLARKYGVPLDRAHIVGHDNVPGPTRASVRSMHNDPGPFWDWAHYFELLGRPLARVARSGGLPSRSVMILPRFAAHRQRFTGCGGGCPARGSSSVWLHTRPSATAPLVKDIGKHPGGRSSYGVQDHAARASTGQRYAVADRRGAWTAIWYLGQKAWFHDPKGARTAVRAAGPLVTPRPGVSSVKLYGRGYPEPGAYRGVSPQKLTPLQYVMPAGQRYSVGLVRRGSYLRAVTFDTSKHRLITGGTVYYQVQFGHRFAFVRAADVTLLRR
ncbi:N-acetylmuramoyl-L-alanine amidase [Planobispora siamensis]|uniref:N-acetylmuramoyl-L-alanine amidase n=1 Tax=Planobispora siamensis TaxID=936338 RepID=A0A8J3WME5_9ACTN|nr:peptidoglycan recognition family protein [Planobispora siamensis]GIH92791.1 amidase [Planobispora siamensis]